LIVGIFVKLKAARSRNPGDKKTAQAGVYLPHAPDAESGQYRNVSLARNNIFAHFCLGSVENFLWLTVPFLSLISV
jgi:hypothetical protein